VSTGVVVDASVWVSSMRKEDVNHNVSRLWMKKFVTHGGFMVATTFLYIEVAAAISRQTRDASLAQQAIRDLGAFKASHDLHVSTLNSAFIRRATNVAIDLRLRAGDATYVALAYQLNIPLVSWDKEQLERASSLVTTYTPDKYVFETGESEAEDET